MPLRKAAKPFFSFFDSFISASFSNLLYPKGFYYYDDKLNTCIKKTNGLSNNGYVKELFSNIYYCMKKEFAHVLVLKNDNKYIQQSFSIPEPNQFVIECKDPIMIKLLNGIVDKNIINYLNANNDSAAIELFNSKQKITENNLIDNIIGKYLIEIVKNISSSAIIGFYMSSSISTVAAKYRLAALLCKNSIQND